MTTLDHIRVHRQSTRHLVEVLASDGCGCFYCRAIFKPSEIGGWVDEWEGGGQTALCPRCGIDSVIGSESGYPITEESLAQMQAHWF